MRIASIAAAVAMDSSDEELLSRMARGDVDAFGLFYDRHSSLLFGLAVKILCDHHEAEEVLQEALVLIFERAPTYDAALGKPLSWAVTVTRNKSIDRLRGLQRKRRLLNEVASKAEVQGSEAINNPLQKALEGESVGAIHNALAQLPVEQRRAIELAFLGGLTHSEIAERLGDPLGTVKARIRRGMLFLRDCLEGQL